MPPERVVNTWPVDDLLAWPTATRVTGVRNGDGARLLREA